MTQKKHLRAHLKQLTSGKTSYGHSNRHRIASLVFCFSILPIILFGQCDSLAWTAAIQAVSEVKLDDRKPALVSLKHLAIFEKYNRAHLKNSRASQKAQQILLRHPNAVVNTLIPYLDLDSISKANILIIYDSARVQLKLATRIILDDYGSKKETMELLDSLAHKYLKGPTNLRDNIIIKDLVKTILLSQSKSMHDYFVCIWKQNKFEERIYIRGKDFECRDLVFFSVEDCHSKKVDELLRGTIYQKRFLNRIFLDGIIETLPQCSRWPLVYERVELPLSARKNPFEVRVIITLSEGTDILRNYLKGSFNMDLEFHNQVLDEGTYYLVKRFH